MNEELTQQPVQPTPEPTPTPPAQPQPQVRKSMLSNKSVIIGIVALVILLIIIVFIIGLNTSQKKPQGEQPVNITVTTIPTSAPIQITPTVTQPSLSEEITTIKTQAKPQLDQKIDIPYQISKVKTYENDWAILEVTNPTTDPANVVLNQQNGQWVVIDGPGTYLDQQTLKEKGAPQSLLDDVNQNL